ncbi:NUDIX hydrolase [Ignatzschineria rhizosphaerae]|uniref:NUDIX hydrolase n=1 Tax=Ignatzschineria rhizosphaerae TaxID=2923279 RepID=A0ABY3X5P8_9GAMM|nr:NUDIX hydrolase [Ignatzschineria rhizosphaerae]UNM96367.1 NUDIX hydrolase [Ignatzschineria rhizosphaerae]
MMKIVNLIVVFNPDETKVLMCQRTRDPYLGLYNFVGGKVDPGEDLLEAAYRELFEETGIEKGDIALTHMIDYIYPIDQLTMNIYYGVLNKEVVLIEEKQPLLWFDVTQNFMAVSFAGNGNLYHMVECAKYYLTKAKAQ